MGHPLPRLREGHGTPAGATAAASPASSSGVLGDFCPWLVRDAKCGVREGDALRRRGAGCGRENEPSNLQDGSREERGNLVFMIEAGKTPQPCSSADAEVSLAAGEHPVMHSPAWFGPGPWLGNGAGGAALHPSGLE